MLERIESLWLMYRYSRSKLGMSRWRAARFAVASDGMSNLQAYLERMRDVFPESD